MSEWTDITNESELANGEIKLLEIADTRIAIINLDGEYFAIKDVCSHEGFPMLGCGLEPAKLIQGDELLCPRHGARFSIRNGEPLCPPAFEPIHTYEVRLHEGMVQIMAPKPDN
ncbi:MAG: non-heme iron oxygenase ferredoxin subunit [Gammaproteobacteria bacterium]|nr:non-heme iron oxygenase ferredoxin subunit [Gammaproteobacteria bacterium]